MTSGYLVTHISEKLSSGLNAFTQELEDALGWLDVPALQKVGYDPEATNTAITAMQVKRHDFI